ncbi:helix-turn-helix domain-containing protein [Allorhizobium sp. BGMRC 0089]|uniref:helix-turn-helix domain-containing protein n=1 Tax=Allorhizobium sonneratiae TaxID=2934936 RepID=UPI002033B01A|nr:helix-turn-helix transcriptional regulator [Allorhizobium sonneratiae]MCM2292270.1 helix-turn-helix domain-containing protein [Allorhizobium sonneratiae]
MQPEQMRAARAILNWSLERLAAESGVHRNTLYNFETSKFAGKPETIAAAKEALMSAGALFFDNDLDVPAVGIRRFEVGDWVKFRPETRVRYDYGIAADELGVVIGVEPHPPQMGPTYRISVQFGESQPLPYVHKFEYELVHPVISSLPEFTGTSGMQMIPNGQFVARPALNAKPQIETDLAKLPQELRSLIIIPTADPRLRDEVEKRGFATREVSPTLCLLWRQFPDGVLKTDLYSGAADENLDH